VLLVESAADLPREVRRSLCERFDVTAVPGADQALAACERGGPFAVVVADQEIAQDREFARNGIELLETFRRGWPDTARVILAEPGDLDMTLRAVHEAAVFRFLPKPVELDDLLEAVESGARRFAQMAEERLATDQLLFARETLLHQVATLEQRKVDELDRVRVLQHVATSLVEADSLEAVAERLGRACAQLLGPRPMVIELSDPTADLRVEHRTGEVSSARFVEPVRTLDGEIGFLGVDEGEIDGRRLSEGDRRMVAVFASYGALAANGLIQRRGRERAQYATVLALARLAENREDVVRRHLERVGPYCRLIARTLRRQGHHTEVIDDAYLEDLTRSAPLHDIGNVRVPDSILLKPGPLTGPEREAMRRHAAIGAETMLEVLDSAGEQGFLRMGHEIAWAHHERWDGSGYPRALEGEEIPLAARIMAVVDCYDALTTRRPYRDAWSHEEAVDYVRKQRGTHFDPLVVGAFEECVDELVAIRVRLADPDDDRVREHAA